MAAPTPPHFVNIAPEHVLSDGGTRSAITGRVKPNLELHKTFDVVKSGISWNNIELHIYAQPVYWINLKTELAKAPTMTMHTKMIDGPIVATARLPLGSTTVEFSIGHVKSEDYNADKIDSKSTDDRGEHMESKKIEDRHNINDFDTQWTPVNHEGHLKPKYLFTVAGQQYEWRKTHQKGTLSIRRQR